MEEEPEDGHADPEPMDSEDEPKPMEQDLELEVAPEDDAMKNRPPLKYCDQQHRPGSKWTGLDRIELMHPG
ncbi:hypothetical protein NL676_004982 [Syzygium grande]|nr:hypothetical protein NL676_004982 [Syzygium grande]